MSIDMVGNFITCAVIAALSSLLKVAKFVLSLTITLEIFVYLVITI